MTTTLRRLSVIAAVWLYAALVFGQQAADQPLFTFVVTADPHVSENRPGQPSGAEKFAQLIGKVHGFPHRPDFILIAGDIYAEAFKKALAAVSNDIPIHVVAGNHDNRSGRDELWKLFPGDFQGNDFYAFTHKSALVIGLCDAAYQDHVGHFNSESIKGQEQCAWLRRQLAEHAGKVDYVFMFAHIPPQPLGEAGPTVMSLNDQVFFRDLVLKYKPTALFFGHLHQKLEFKIGDTPVYVVPSANWNYGNQAREFLEVQVYKAGIRTAYIPIGP